MEKLHHFKATKIITVLLLILNLLITSDCKKKSSSLELEEAPSSQYKSSKKSKSKNKAKNQKVPNLKKDGLNPVPLLNFDLSKERLIEYSVKIEMKVENVKTARLKLLRLVEEYGYVKKWNSINNKYANYNNIHFKVPAEKLFQAMRQIEFLGRVSKENLNTIDHTVSYHRENLKSKRTAFRIATRLQHLNKKNKVASDYLQQQSALENAEDMEDDTNHKKWLLKDKVKWAGIAVKISGPEKQIYKSIEIPDFENGFYNLIEALLALIYSLIFIVPFSLLAFAFYLIVRKAIQFIKLKYFNN